MASVIDDILGPEGLLSKALDNYEHRPQQLEMAQAVALALKDKQRLVVEAATGTGKSLAYLVPALLSGKRVVISTGTKALQEQLFQKDLPLLAKHWHEEFDAVLLKGRRNYLCQWRMQDMLMAPRFRGPNDAKFWPDIMEWSRKTEVGDRAEVKGLPDDYPTWADLSISSDACTGSKCKFYENCFVTQARRRAQEAKIIVVNHHLFFADLALRKTTYAEILPEYDAVIFDEAHHLEDVASAYFGMQISNYRISELIGDIKRWMDKEAVADKSIEKVIKELGVDGSSLFSLMAFGLYEGRYPLREALEGSQREKIKEAQRQLSDTIADLEREFKRFATKIEGSERLAERTTNLKFEIDSVLRADDDHYTYFLEIKNNGVFVQAAPIDLAQLFQDKLLDGRDAMIFTSATLSTNDTFDYFKQRMGLVPKSKGKDASKPPDDLVLEQEDDKPKSRPALTGAPELRELRLEPVFDYETQCVVYIPEKLPEPNHPAFVEGVAKIVKYLVSITEGRAFVLFTSWANMNRVHEMLEHELTQTVLKQGERPKAQLIQAFKEDRTSVLFATSSFWEGVDVEGDALQLVIIDKLPFASPGDPLVKARMDLLEARGGNSFMDYSVPSAALTLKQGFGRLIRSRQDIGIVAILDSRIATKRYGKYFLKSLPPAPVVWTAPAVKRWWYDKHNLWEE